MKSVRNFGRMALSLLLCCAVLTCTAFAAETEVFHLGNVTIVSNHAPSEIMPLKELHLFYDNEVGTCTFNSGRKYPGTCRAVNGDYLALQVTNTGNTDLKIRFSVTIDGDTVAVNEILTPQQRVYSTSAFTKDGSGLNCTFEVEILSADRLKSGDYTIYAAQYWT